MHGIIAVEGDMRDSDTYIGCLKTLLDIIIPFGEVYVKHKIQLKRDEINMRYINDEGHMSITRIKLENEHTYEWINDGSEKMEI